MHGEAMGGGEDDTDIGNCTTSVRAGDYGDRAANVQRDSSAAACNDYFREAAPVGFASSRRVTFFLLCALIA